jgi:hypothetical protein
MLNKLDDYPVHQTPEPIAHPETSDRRFYDRTWFNGYSADGSYYFGIGMAIYPYLGIMDCAFSVVEKNGRQHCFYGSRRAPLERTEMTVGPFKIEVLEPMRKTRVTLEENESGLTCDLMFSSRTAPIQENRQTLWQGARRTMDATRFDQFGFWSGHLSHPDGKINVEASVCHGTKDRSWGVRGIGAPETGSAPSAPGGIFFLWAPLFWKDHVSHAIFFDGTKGEALVREGLTAPLHKSEADIPDTAEPQDERMATAIHRVKYHPATRLASSAEIDLINLQGEKRTIHLEPILKFQMKGLGYLHPEWGQGFWKGELAIGGESFETNQLDLLAKENVHVQQVVKATDGENEGIGVLEQLVIGPYAPAGFTEFFDGFKGD